jgi:hypothetical protein
MKTTPAPARATLRMAVPARVRGYQAPLTTMNATAVAGAIGMN